MNSPQHPTRPQSSTSDKAYTIIVCATLVIFAIYLFLGDWLWYLVPAVILVAAFAGLIWYSRLWDRTKGRSHDAYRAAQAATTEPVPPPPQSFNWVDHELYRDSIAKPAATKVEEFQLDQRSRLEHELIVAPIGHGKTQLLEWQILKDLNQPEPPAIIVIDSKTPHPDFEKSNLIDRISRLDLFHPLHGRLKDKLIIVDPKEAPALNLFDVPRADEETTNEIISQLAYFLGALLEEGTSKTQAALYQPLARLMLAVEGANLTTLVRAVDNIKDFTRQIDTLDPDLRYFLLNELPLIFGKGTKDAVKRRVYGMTIQSPTFGKMFNARTNQLDLTTALNNGKIVLVSTDAQFLKDLSPVFGKFVISRAISAALAGKRRPAFIYIDEAKPYTDEKTEELLRFMRSYKLGAVLAYQTFPDLSASLRTVTMANTTIKFIGGGDDEAAHIFARHVRAEPEFIYNQLQDSHSPPRFTRFALHVKNKTPTAVPYQIPIGSLDKVPRMDDAAYRQLREKNRQALQDPPLNADQSAEPRADKNVSED